MMNRDGFWQDWSYSFGKIIYDKCMKKYIFGLGTGRCGTLSLARLLSLQDESFVTHEGLLVTEKVCFGEKFLPLLGWNFSEPEIRAHVGSVTQFQGDVIVDVAFYYLNYVEYLIKHLEWIRFICLKRDRAATIRSFLQWNRFNIFDSREERAKMQLTVWHRCFPKYDLLTKKESLVRYWEDYYRQSECLAARYPQNFRIFDTAVLNSNHGVREILTFLDIPSERQRLFKGIRLHTSANVAQERLLTFVRGCVKGALWRCSMEWRRILDLFFRKRASRMKLSPPDGACVIWLTGLSGAGKSTLAEGLREVYCRRGIAVERLDGDVIRAASPEIGFTKEARDEHIGRVGVLAASIERQGTVVIASFISPYREGRLAVRKMCRNFIEVYVEASVEECERRDPKGLYKKARGGGISYFTGISAPYEPPLSPEITIRTEGASVGCSLQQLVHKVDRLNGFRQGWRGGVISSAGGKPDAGLFCS